MGHGTRKPGIGCTHVVSGRSRLAVIEESAGAPIHNANIEVKVVASVLIGEFGGFGHRFAMGACQNDRVKLTEVRYFLEILLQGGLKHPITVWEGSSGNQGKR